MMCSIAFTIILIPQVLFNYKNKLCEITYKSSIPTALFMGIITLVYAANSFWLSVIMGSATTLIWTIIATQRYLYNRS